MAEQHAESSSPMLTDAQCKNALCQPDKPRRRLADSGGLYLEVSPGGSKRWFWKYRNEGKEYRLALGSYPAVGLTAARRARDAAKLKKAEGTDPVQARKVEKLKAVNLEGDSFKVVALEWYQKRESNWSEAYSVRSKRQLERDLFPWLGNRRIAEIEPVELLATLRKVEERGAVETANRGLDLARQVWRYAVATVNRPGFTRHFRAVGIDVFRTLPEKHRQTCCGGAWGCRTSLCN